MHANATGTRKWVIGSAIGCAIAVVVVLAIWIVSIAVPAWHWQISVGRTLERELGFQHGTPYIDLGGDWCEVVTIDAVVPGGVFDRAGFRSGDVVCGLSSSELFQRLHDGRGQRVTVRVVDGGGGPALAQRQGRDVTFLMPVGR